MQAEPNPSGLCMCGCGRETKIARSNVPRLGHIKGKPIRYLHGHSGQQPPPTVFPGDRFGRLVVVSESEHRGSKNARRYLCACACGEEKEVLGSSLRIGETRSCGCLGRECSVTHGLTGTPTFNSWQAMTTRCTNPNAEKWPTYGGRGITICERMSTVQGFVQTLGLRPSGLTIDRIDNDGGYWCGACSECQSHGRPMNVRWADAATQRRNQRRVA